jgi:exonuclease VII large subunit
MTTFNTISFIASIASLILAIGAIWLSVVFYRMSSAAQNSTIEASKGIASSVERLEKLFDKLYSDTFSMMRDTVSDMRKHIWPVDDQESEKAVEEAEKRADEKLDGLKKTMDQQLATVLQQQKLTENKFSGLQEQISHMFDRAITQSRQAGTEALEETIRNNVLRELRVLRRRRPVTLVDEVVERLRDRFPARRIVIELERMRSEGIIAMSSERVNPETEVRLRPTAAEAESG